MARRNLLRSQIVSALIKVEEQIAKEAARRMSPGTNQYTNRSTVNLPQTTSESEPKKRNPTTAEQIAKEAAERVGGRPRKEDEKPTSNLTEVSEEPKTRAPETAEIMAKKAGYKSKNTWKNVIRVISVSGGLLQYQNTLYLQGVAEFVTHNPALRKGVLK